MTGSPLLEEFVEIESGKLKDRPILAAAMAACRRHRATLLIAKLDRLGRNVAFIANLMEAGTDFVALDAPYANKMMLQLLAVFAEHEREMISARTKAALAIAKGRGVVLGKNAARLAIRYKGEATAFASTMAGPIAEARLSGATTLRQVAERLNAQSYPTREGATWTPTAVRRVVLRLAT